MARFYVVNSLNDKKSVMFNMSLRYFVIKSESGRYMWTLEIGTTHPAADGSSISSKKIHNISANNLDEIIESSLAELCAQIDWSPLVQDIDAPYIDSYSPLNGSTVSIESDINVVIKDRLLSAGIDLSDMQVILNNGTTSFDITSEVQVSGDPYEYKLKWSPPRRVYSTYD